MVPLDGSPLAEAALEPAAYLARLADARVVVVRSPVTAQNVSGWDDPSPVLDAQEIECQTYLEKVVEKLQAQGVQARWEMLEPGSPSERLLEAIEDEEIDLVILTSHGRSGLSRVLLGSVAETLSRYSRAPVMIVGRRSDAMGRFKDQQNQQKTAP